VDSPKTELLNRIALAVGIRTNHGEVPEATLETDERGDTSVLSGIDIYALMGQLLDWLTRKGWKITFLKSAYSARCRIETQAGGIEARYEGSNRNGFAAFVDVTLKALSLEDAGQAATERSFSPDTLGPLFVERQVEIANIWAQLNRAGLRLVLPDDIANLSPERLLERAGYQVLLERINSNDIAIGMKGHRIIGTADVDGTAAIDLSQHLAYLMQPY
jgi:hypothetical protein